MERIDLNIQPGGGNYRGSSKKSSNAVVALVLAFFGLSSLLSSLAFLLALLALSK